MIRRSSAAVISALGTNLGAVVLMSYLGGLSGVLVGSVAVALALFATVGYVLRKREVVSVGATSGWLVAHVWLSSAALVAALAHGRFSLHTLLPAFVVVLSEVVLVSGALVWMTLSVGGGMGTRNRLWWLRHLHVEASIIALGAVGAHAVTALFYGGLR